MNKVNRNPRRTGKVSTLRLKKTAGTLASIEDEPILAAPRRPSNDGDPEQTDSGKRKRITWSSKTVALVAALVAIPFAYWQGSIQSSHSAFERNQRVVELSISLATFWETQLDSDTRYRVGRFVARQRSLATDEDKRSLAHSLADVNTLRDSESILQNKLLYELIKPDLDTENADGLKMTPVMAVSRYRAALIRTLNTMENIAIVKKHSKELPEALDVINDAYFGAIQQRYKDLSFFVEEYHKLTNEGRRKPAWEPLINMVEEEDRKLKEDLASEKP